MGVAAENHATRQRREAAACRGALSPRPRHSWNLAPSLKCSGRELQERVLELDLLRLEAGDAGAGGEEGFDDEVVAVRGGVAVGVGEVDDQGVRGGVLGDFGDTEVSGESFSDERCGGA